MNRILLLFFLVVNLTFSQNRKDIDHLRLECSYLITYQPDSTSVESKRSETMLLLIGEKSSKFISAGMRAIDSVSQDMAARQVTSIDLTNMFNKIPRTKIKEVIYKNYPTDKLSVVDIIGRDYYLYEEDLNKFQWNISPEIKDIHGQECQKATLSYGGRNYEAWFSKEISVSDGPYKFGGLPGLIVSIQDDRGQYKYELLDVVPKEDRSIYFKQKDFLEVSKAGFYNQKSKFYGNFLTNAENSGLTLKFDNPTEKKNIQNRLKNNNNNPIELKIDR